MVMAMFVSRKELERILRNLRKLEQDIRIDLSNIEFLAGQLEQIATPPRLRHNRKSFIYKVYSGYIGEDYEKSSVYR